MEQCVVRKAIKAANQDSILGYELLFQSSDKGGLYNENENNAADTVASFLMNNSKKIFDKNLIFLTFTPNLLLRNTPKIFQKDKIIIQISDNLIIHPLAMPIIEKYHKQGYQFAINDFQFSPKYFSMLEYAQYIRIGLKPDMTDKEISSIDNVVRMAQGMGKKCILTDVDTKEIYETALKLNGDYVEGNYVAEAMSVKAEKGEYMQGNFFQLVVAVAKEEPDMEEIENIISRDAWLTYSILKLVNSAFFALRRRTASIRQAIMTMGISQLRQWVYMLSLKNSETEGSKEILRLSFLRAKFAESLAKIVNSKELSSTEAYMMGMFSALEYMVNAPLSEVLAEIPIGDNIKNALLKGEGLGGDIQNLVLCYEKADWKECKAIAEKLNLSTAVLSQTYINCVEEVNSIWESLTTDSGSSQGVFNLSNEDDDREKLEDILQ